MKDDLIKQLKQYTLLCIEDEDQIRVGIVNTLKYYFKEVYEASNVSDASDIYEEEKPTIILCDIQMPKENGISFIKRLRKHDKDTIVIMITAHSSEEYLLDLINLKINHYLQKPISSDILLDALLEVLDEKLDKHLYFSKDLYLDTKNYKLFYQKKEVLLRKRDIDFLFLLYKNKEQVLPYSLIEDNLWKDKSMSTSALKTFIKEFRQRMPLDIIVNIQQIGYKLEEF